MATNPLVNTRTFVTVAVLVAFLVAVALGIGIFNSGMRIITRSEAHCGDYGMALSEEGPYMTAQCVDLSTGIVYDPQILARLRLRDVRENTKTK